MQFKPCISRNACTEDGTHCRACGRSHAEILRTRLLVNAISAFACEMDYENADEFFEYIAKKANKKLQHAKITS